MYQSYTAPRHNRNRQKLFVVINKPNFKKRFVIVKYSLIIEVRTQIQVAINRKLIDDFIVISIDDQSMISIDDFNR